MLNSHHVTFSIEHLPGNSARARVIVEKSTVDAVYRHTLLKIQKEARAQGFMKGQAPLTYLDTAYRSAIVEHLKAFFLNHCVLGTLYQGLMRHKIILAGEPRLVQLNLKPESDAEFIFELIQIGVQAKQHDWKKLPFKAPSRKNYKDLDRQVVTFAKEEERLAQQNTHAIMFHDWVCFNLWLIDETGNLVLNGYYDTLWIKIGEEEADTEAQHIFLNKKKGDRIHSSSIIFQHYVSQEFDAAYQFLIEIVDVVPSVVFSFEQFKHHFKIKNTKEVHAKFIEIFSYRNDLSQRRETTEKAFQAILGQYPMDIPLSLIAERESALMASIQNNPDYFVYKAQQDFKARIKELAVKQLKEIAFVDNTSYHEELITDHDDIVCYLNLLKRQRTKEFIHFLLPPTRINDQERPINQEIIRHYCMREKTLNHILNYLTKKSQS